MIESVKKQELTLLEGIKSSSQQIQTQGRIRLAKRHLEKLGLQEEDFIIIKVGRTSNKDCLVVFPGEVIEKK